MHEITYAMNTGHVVKGSDIKKYFYEKNMEGIIQIRMGWSKTSSLMNSWNSEWWNTFSGVNSALVSYGTLTSDSRPKDVFVSHWCSKLIHFYFLKSNINVWKLYFLPKGFELPTHNPSTRSSFCSSIDVRMQMMQKTHIMSLMFTPKRISRCKRLTDCILN